MNFRQVQIFVTVLETGSLTEAAAVLGLTQPAISKSLKQLEDSLGVVLFYREARGIRATDEARAFYLEARRMVESFAGLSAFARDLPRLTHARLSVACMPAISLDWLPMAVQGFVSAYPDAPMTFQTRSSPETAQLVAQGAVDVGISQVWTDDAAIRKTHLMDIALCCVVPAGHRLAQRKVIRLRDLDGEQLVLVGKMDEVRKTFEAGMHLAGHRFDSRIEVGVGAMLLRMVEVTGQIGVIDDFSARMHRPGATVLLPVEPRLTVPIYLLQSATRPLGLFARTFVNHIRDFAAKGSA